MASGHLLALGATITLLMTTPLVSASTPNGRRQAVTASPPPKQWITIDEDGAARTITPTVTTIDQALQTISGAPSSLTAQSTWFLSNNGMTTTTVFAPHPAPTAEYRREKGALLVCENYYGEDKPFCTPKRGSMLNPNSTYYITWDPQKFAHQDDKLKIEVVYDDSRAEVIAQSVKASVGYHAWMVPDDLLARSGSTAMNASIKYNYQSHDSSEFNEIRGNGPRVVITDNVMWPVNNADGNGSSGPVPSIVIVPMVVVLLLVVGLYCCWSYRKKGIVPFAAAFANLKRRLTRGRGSQGYGVRKSRPERTRTANPTQNVEMPRAAARGDPFRANYHPEDKTPGIQLTSSDSWSPTSTSGRNVFREEIRRQEGRK
ncbi:hypothetical protein PpBr36_03076 [Pyricularia pennisetigena]|uniref:hypothetical protein n=1 Tax=Pyricularia pennisetigena TaxID=1578925 RepID=UPI001151D6F8|nr:hypothetical protein PpBr36_03076 [Pyricularia pennisetigena]TLS30078.1 hypothetical protein PpBr36_03076 [Pyricularia pennisetigena]